MRHEDLFLLSYALSSDDDGNPFEEVTVGYDKALNLVVLLEHTDADFPERNCSSYAIIKKDEAFWLAKKLKATMKELPSIVTGSIDDENYDLINPTLNDTGRCFAELIDRFLEEGCHPRLSRTPSQTGYSCY